MCHLSTPHGRRRRRRRRCLASPTSHAIAVSPCRALPKSSSSSRASCPPRRSLARLNDLLIAHVKPAGTLFPHLLLRPPLHLYLPLVSRSLRARTINCLSGLAQPFLPEAAASFAIPRPSPWPAPHSLTSLTRLGHHRQSRASTPPPPCLITQLCRPFFPPPVRAPVPRGQRRTRPRPRPRPCPLASRSRSKPRRHWPPRAMPALSMPAATVAAPTPALSTSSGTSRHTRSAAASPARFATSRLRARTCCGGTLPTTKTTRPRSAAARPLLPAPAA